MAPDRRLGAANSRFGEALGRAQITRFWSLGAGRPASRWDGRWGWRGRPLLPAGGAAQLGPCWPGWRLLAG
jgi:hypothetical protein